MSWSDGLSLLKFVEQNTYISNIYDSTLGLKTTCLSKELWGKEYLIRKDLKLNSLPKDQ